MTITGTVDGYNERRGIGFIRPDPWERKGKLRVSRADVEKAGLKTLKAGQRVSFRVGKIKALGVEYAWDLALVRSEDER